MSKIRLGGSALVGADGAATSALARIVTTMLGIGALAAGAVAVFVSTNSVGTAALIAAGLVLIAFGAFGERIRAIEGAGVKLQLQEEAVVLYRAASEAEGAGQHEVAEQLREKAEQLLGAARGIASQYERVRAEESSSWERTARLEALVQQARELSSLVSSPKDVESLFNTGRDGNRVSALAMIQGNPALAIIPIICEAVANPRSAFEQYQALKSAESATARGLNDEDAKQLGETVAEALSSGALGAIDSDRCRVAQRVLAMMPS